MRVINAATVKGTFFNKGIYVPSNFVVVVAIDGKEYLHGTFAGSTEKAEKLVEKIQAKGEINPSLWQPLDERSEDDLCVYRPEELVLA